MATATIKCPECGGDKTVSVGLNTYNCRYCGATFVHDSGTAPDAARCPYCGGDIKKGAKKCRNCGEWLVGQENIPPTAPPPTHFAQGVGSYAPRSPLEIKSVKNKYVAAALAFFLGPLGIHEFYLNRYKAGIAFLLVTLLLGWTIIPFAIVCIICLVQCISYLCMSDDEFNDKYNTPR